MATSIRRLLRLAIRDVLANTSNGFNPTFATIAADYGVDPFTVDFAEGSRNLFFGFLPPQSELSGIAEYPALMIYTADAVNQHINKPLTFSGPITAHVDAWLRFRDGAEQYDTETVCEAVEAAMVECFERDSAAWPPGVSFTGQYQSFWQPIAHLEDGWERIIPMEFAFQIDV